MSIGPRQMSVEYSTGPTALTADTTDIPFWWNNTGKDWYLDGDNPPTITSIDAKTGVGSTSDGLQFLRTKLLRVSAAAAETGLCEHVLTTGNSLTAKVGDAFDKMTGSSYVIPTGTGVNLDFDMGAGAVNLTVSGYTQVVANFLCGEGTDQS